MVVDLSHDKWEVSPVIYCSCVDIGERKGGGDILLVGDGVFVCFLTIEVGTVFFFCVCGSAAPRTQEHVQANNK